MLLIKNNRLFYPLMTYKKSIKKPRLIRLRCDRDFLRTNMMADYIDKMSTDINYITYVEENEEESYLQLIIIIGLLLYMFLDKDRQS